MDSNFGAFNPDAKAMRPWYRKKRWWIGGGLAVMFIVGLIGSAIEEQGETSRQSSGSSSRQTSTTSRQTTTTVGQGLGSQDASGDISGLDCGTPDALGFTYPSVQVTNRSEKTSTYFITIVAESSDGRTRYDDTIITVNSLNPGQTMRADGLPFTVEFPGGSVCRVSEVQRTAG